MYHVHFTFVEEDRNSLSDLATKRCRGVVLALASQEDVELRRFLRDDHEAAWPRLDFTEVPVADGDVVLPPAVGRNGHVSVGSGDLGVDDIHGDRLVCREAQSLANRDLSVTDLHRPIQLLSVAECLDLVRLEFEARLSVASKILQRHLCVKCRRDIDLKSFDREWQDLIGWDSDPKLCALTASAQNRLCGWALALCRQIQAGEQQDNEWEEGTHGEALEHEASKRIKMSTSVPTKDPFVQCCYVAQATLPVFCKKVPMPVTTIINKKWAIGFRKPLKNLPKMGPSAGGAQGPTTTRREHVVAPDRSVRR